MRDFCDLIRGVTFRKSQSLYSPAKGFAPILRAGNISDKLNLSEDLIWIPQDLLSKKQRFITGDIAICIASGSKKVVGKTAILKQQWEGSVGAFCGIVRTTTMALSQYIAYWFRSDSFLQWRDTQATGANIQNIKLSELGNVFITLPPLDEQKRIVAVLDKQMAEIDIMRLVAQKRVSAAQVMPAALLRQTFGEPS